MPWAGSFAYDQTLPSRQPECKALLTCKVDSKEACLQQAGLLVRQPLLAATAGAALAAKLQTGTPCASRRLGRNPAAAAGSPQSWPLSCAGQQETQPILPRAGQRKTQPLLNLHMSPQAVVRNRSF